ncbi:MAG: ECF transporter S component [Lachnospiraceae bacterium]|nr:ECF transporter S component [Lachnospiraceae bacterium]
MNKTSFNTTYLVQLALLVAIILLMAFTPIGYIKTLGLEITLIVVPVTVGAVILGPKGGAILGFVFGLTSFIQCFGMSPFGSVLLGLNPFGCFMVCVPTRTLMGWLTGLIYKAFKGKKLKTLPHFVANLAGPIMNTLFFMTMLILFFFQSDYIQGLAGGLNPFAFVIAFVGINGLIEAAACFVAGTAISKVLTMALNRGI